MADEESATFDVVERAMVEISPDAADGAAALGLEPRAPRARRHEPDRRARPSARSSRRSRASPCGGATRSCSTRARRSMPARSCATGPSGACSAVCVPDQLHGPRARRPACDRARGRAAQRASRSPSSRRSPRRRARGSAPCAPSRTRSCRPRRTASPGSINRRTLESQLREPDPARPAVRARDRRPRPLQAAQRHARARGRRPRPARVRHRPLRTCCATAICSRAGAARSS